MCSNCDDELMLLRESSRLYLLPAYPTSQLLSKPISYSGSSYTEPELLAAILFSSAGLYMTFHNQFAASYNNNPMTPAPIRTALGDAMNTNTAATRPTRKKRKRTEKNSEANTRRRLNNELGVDAPAVFGVGPLSAGGRRFCGRIGRYSPPFHVWYFIRGVHSDTKPESLPEREVISTKRPGKEFSHLACRLCTGDEWTTWKNVKGQTTAIHNHLKSQSHEKVWHDIVLLKQLKGWETLGTSNKNSPSGEHEPFSLPGFYNRLVKWIAVDDQSLDVINCPELQDTYRFQIPALVRVVIWGG
ncbi:hypothetical protein B0H14DRAFT_2625605 [Mycena olivaceomarginata]|nr:hypothetical protein B0H14DRAFT_2625605 [Mycena olivaceomarginata]